MWQQFKMNARDLGWKAVAGGLFLMVPGTVLLCSSIINEGGTIRDTHAGILIMGLAVAATILNIMFHEVPKDD